MIRRDIGSSRANALSSLLRVGKHFFFLPMSGSIGARLPTLVPDVVRRLFQRSLCRFGRRRYTCEGDDISPALEWAGVPKDTKSVALIVDDPDAPDPAAPKCVWVHWVLYDISPDVTGLLEGIGGADLPAGTLEGLNDWEKVGYGGPCPPIGRHRYFLSREPVLHHHGGQGQLAEPVVRVIGLHRPSLVDRVERVH